MDNEALRRGRLSRQWSAIGRGRCTREGGEP